MSRPSARPMIALLASALVLGACGGSTPAAPTAAVGSGGATGTSTTTSGSSAPGSSSAAPTGGTSAAPTAATTATPATSASRGSTGGPGSTAPGSPTASPSAAPGSPAAPSDGGALPAASNRTGDQPTIGIPGLGLSLRLPPGWVGLDSTVPTSILDSTGARFPDLAPTLASLRAGELGFVGYDATSTEPTTPPVTIATTGDAIAVAALLDALAEQTATQLSKTAAISGVQHSTVTLPAGPAAELRYQQKPADGGPEVAMDSWFISTANHTFLVAFLVSVSSADEWQAQFRAVAESLSGS